MSRKQAAQEHVEFSHLMFFHVSGEPTQLRRVVRLPPPGGERRRPRHGERGLRASHRQHAAHPGEETLETIHLPVDQLRPVRRAGGQGRLTLLLSSFTTSEHVGVIKCFITTRCISIFHQDPERTRQVYQACLDLIPHKKVSFYKTISVS